MRTKNFGCKLTFFFHVTCKVNINFFYFLGVYFSVMILFSNHCEVVEGLNMVCYEFQ